MAHFYPGAAAPSMGVGVHSGRGPDGGRGFGFTGGHNHLNWGNDDFRKTVLNAILWVAKAKVPKEGVPSKLTEDDLYANLAPKRGQKPRPKSSPKKK